MMVNVEPKDFILLTLKVPCFGSILQQNRFNSKADRNAAPATVRPLSEGVSLVSDIFSVSN